MEEERKKYLIEALMRFHSNVGHRQRHHRGASHCCPTIRIGISHPSCAGPRICAKKLTAIERCNDNEASREYCFTQVCQDEIFVFIRDLIPKSHGRWNQCRKHDVVWDTRIRITLLNAAAVLDLAPRSRRCKRAAKQSFTLLST